MGDRPLGLSVGRVDVDDARRISAAPWSIVARIGPELTGLGAPTARIEHWRRRLVSKQPGRSLELDEQPLVNRAQKPGGAADPVGKRRAIEVDPLAGVDLGLPVERKVIGVFGDQDLGDRRLGRQAAFDQSSRRRRLHHDVLACPAGVFGPTHDQDPELGRHDVESLASVLADAMQRALAARAGMIIDVDHHLDARQMRRQ